MTSASDRGATGEGMCQPALQVQRWVRRSVPNRAGRWAPAQGECASANPSGRLRNLDAPDTPGFSGFGVDPSPMALGRFTILRPRRTRRSRGAGVATNRCLPAPTMRNCRD